MQRNALGGWKNKLGRMMECLQKGVPRGYVENCLSRLGLSENLHDNAWPRDSASIVLYSRYGSLTFLTPS
jgi:hypothetical protein